ncbi:caspase family protein [Hyalangium sp.]|uniref:caspase family protein n=1 Tax=Hyalangium sp. TaxID=2028555 RepID=UPI002D436AFA|nr:caspase family protein [Hyalangium sp.]HYI02338.1 caspase family protein [Hyalangium sp.]
MPGHALIIGSQTHGLTGVLGDAQRVAQVLGGRGFEVSPCVGADATREGILQSYRRLIETCAPDEAAFVYYAGHGAWSPEPGRGFQFIVPVDFDQSTEEDFRGITSPELSGLLQELTAKTRNVTVVLDCCFAACMFRGMDMVPRALPEVSLPAVRAHLTRLQAQGVALGGPYVESNPHAVRLVASAIDEPAYEYTNTRGVRTGLLTDTFLEVLQEARGLQVSWGQLARHVRERVLARCPMQRPELEGPARRLLFHLEELEQDTALVYYPERNWHWLRGGRLHGVNLGDEYAVMPLGALGPDPERALALARVIEVQGGCSRVVLEREAGVALPTGAPAFRIRFAHPRRAVALGGPWEATSPLWLRLREGLESSPFVRRALEGGQEPVLAHVWLTEEGLDVLDQERDRIVQPLPVVLESVGEVVRAVEVLARAQALRELVSSEGAEWIEQGLELEWGRVVGGREVRLPIAGSCLRASERLYLRLHNRSRSRLYVSVFDVGVSGAVTLLSTSQPSGLVMGPERVELLGARLDGTLAGLELEWPPAVPREGERPESLIIIASDTAVDLRLLETSEHRGVWAAGSPLERLLHQLLVGGMRVAMAPEGEAIPMRYAVKRIGFWLDPRPPAQVR